MPSSLRANRALFPVILLTLAQACYLSPRKEDTGAVTDDGGGISTPTGPLDELRGSLVDGDFAVYWRHYDGWGQGSCVELLLRNQGTSSARISELQLGASDSFTYWADAGGATFWPDGSSITIWPDSTSLSGGGIRRMYYCAEPAAELVSLSVAATTTGGSGADDGAGDEGDDGGAEVNAGSFSQGELVVTWRELWEDPDHGGTCFEFAAFNEGSTPIDLGVLRFEMSGEYEITHYYGLTPTPLSDSLAILFPDYLGALPPIGEDLSDQFRGTVCLDPVVLPVSMEATID